MAKKKKQPETTTIPRLVADLGMKSDKTVRRIVEDQEIEVIRINAKTFVVPPESAERIVKTVLAELAPTLDLARNCEAYLKR